MKATDEYKVCTLEEAETFARKREHMNKKNFPPHIVDGGASYQKKVEEAPYHPGYEDAVVTPAPKYTGMNSEMSAYDLANEVMEHYNAEKQKGFNVNWMQEVANMLRQQQNEIEDLINAHRFIQNFAEEQHQRAVALEMRELTDEEILQFQDKVPYTLGSDLIEFARAILRKAQEK